MNNSDPQNPHLGRPRRRYQGYFIASRYEPRIHSRNPYRMRRILNPAFCTFVLAAALTGAQAQSADSQRKLINSKPPQYPAFLKTMALEGSVRLRVTVAPNGTPKSSEVLGG